MHFALIDNVRTPPSSGLKGFCPVCGSAMIPKCGNERIHHWAHKGKLECDSWWERETLWHRSWKSHFPETWQEVIQHDAHGEKHIADVLTEHGVTVEFQYSHIHPDERASREAFYSKMLWVVSGARLQRDLPNFLEGRHAHLDALGGGVYLSGRPERLFQKKWTNSKVPVLFDFADAVPPEELDKHDARLLWCLLPGRIFGSAVVLAVARKDFVAWTTERAAPFHPPSILANVEQHMVQLAQQQARRNRAAQARVMQLQLMRSQMRQARSGRRRRRF